MDEEKTYPGTSQERPAEILRGGSGVYCCVPACGSATYNNLKEKSGIGMFKFPKDSQMRRKWINVISQYRRKVRNDNFNVNNKTVVCEFHFKINEIKVSLRMGRRKTLIAGVVSSIFTFKQNSNKNTTKRKSPRKRLLVGSNFFENTEGDLILQFLPAVMKAIIQNKKHAQTVLN